MKNTRRLGVKPVSFKLRMTKDLHAILAALCEGGNRSINGAICEAIQDWVDNETAPQTDVMGRFERIEERISKLEQAERQRLLNVPCGRVPD